MLGVARPRFQVGSGQFWCHVRWCEGDVPVSHSNLEPAFTNSVYPASSRPKSFTDEGKNAFDDRNRMSDCLSLSHGIASKPSEASETSNLRRTCT